MNRQEIGERLTRERNALSRQEGGAHYREYSIQPVEYIVANDLGFLAGNVVKYVTRYRDKNGAEDIRKAIHYLELILEFEYPVAPQAASGVPSANGQADCQDSQCDTQQGLRTRRAPLSY